MATDMVRATVIMDRAIMVRCMAVRRIMADPDITGNIAAGKGELVRRSGASLRTSRPSVNRAPSLGRGALLSAPAPDRPAL